MIQAVLWPALMAGFTILFGWLLVDGFRKGEKEFPHFGITLSGRREDQPIRFWLVTLFVAFLMLSAAATTVLAILRPATAGL